jgi:hypothetical protein
MTGVQVLDGKCVACLRDYGQMKKVVIAWESNTSGTVNAIIPLEGFLNCVITNPESPTTLYDITLYNNSADEFLGFVQNRSSSAVETAWISLALTGQKVEYHYLNGKYRLNVANAGNTKQGLIVIEILKTTCVLP